MSMTTGSSGVSESGIAPDIRARSARALKLNVNEAATTIRLRTTAPAMLAALIELLLGWSGREVGSLDLPTPDDLSGGEGSHIGGLVVERIPGGKQQVNRLVLSSMNIGGHRQPRLPNASASCTG